MISILQLDDLSDVQKLKLKDIFYETASIKSFSSPEAKQKFEYKYFGVYQEKYPELFFVGLKGEEVLGYTCACDDTLRMENLIELFPYYEAIDVLEEYPAHLHINLTKNSQGLGVGSKLVARLVEELLLRNIKGLHIFTGVEHPSIKFYRKNNFCDELSVEYNSTLIQFMGRRLID